MQQSFSQKQNICIISFRPPALRQVVTESPDKKSPRGKRASAKARRDARVAVAEVVFEALAAGWSIEQIAQLRKVSRRTVQRDVDRALAERRLDAPERYAHLQVARLNKALHLADEAIDRGELKAIGHMVKVVTALDRYHGLPALSWAAPPAPVIAPPAPPLRLTRAAPPLATPALNAAEPVSDRGAADEYEAQMFQVPCCDEFAAPGPSSGEAWAPEEASSRAPERSARMRSGACGEAFETGMGSADPGVRGVESLEQATGLQRVSEERREAGAAAGNASEAAGSPAGSAENESATDLDAQVFEITESAPKLQSGEAGRRETGADGNGLAPGEGGPGSGDPGGPRALDDSADRHVAPRFARDDLGSFEITGPAPGLHDTERLEPRAPAPSAHPPRPRPPWLPLVGSAS
jgi:hypothetical protein